MQDINLVQVRGWMRVSGDAVIPSVISQKCPHCMELALFTIGNHMRSDSTFSFSLSSVCPACSKAVAFWSIYPEGRFSGRPEKICMYPGLPVLVILQDLPDLVPLPLANAYKSAVKSFDTQNYVATAVLARRTLEGIFKYLLPEERRKQNLFKLIDETKSSVDLSAPLTTLSHAIRDGGNLGAHFDETHEPTKEMASSMIELLSYLISYLYILPSQIKELENILESSPPDKS